MKAIERTYRVVSKGLCKLALYERYYIENDEHGDHITRYYNDKFYYDNYELHDPFRAKYDDIILQGYDETIEYIDNNKDNIILKDNTYSLLEEFFNKYPDAIIEFG